MHVICFVVWSIMIELEGLAAQIFAPTAKVMCTPDFIRFSVHFEDNFFGVIHSAVNRDACKTVGDGHRNAMLYIPLSPPGSQHCGMDDFYAIIIDIRQHHLVNLKGDTAFFIQCTKRSDMFQSVELPRASIASVAVKIGSVPQAEVMMGSTYNLDVELPNTFEYKVSSCVAFSGHQHIKYMPLTDGQGCPIDDTITSFKPENARTARASIDMFRFNDTSQLFIQCAIRHCGFRDCNTGCDRKVKPEALLLPRTIAIGDEEVMSSSMLIVHDAKTSTLIIQKIACDFHSEPKMLLYVFLISLFAFTTIISCVTFMKNSPFRIACQFHEDDDEFEKLANVDDCDVILTSSEKSDPKSTSEKSPSSVYAVQNPVVAYDTVPRRDQLSEHHWSDTADSVDTVVTRLSGNPDHTALPPPPSEEELKRLQIDLTQLEHTTDDEKSVRFSDYNVRLDHNTLSRTLTLSTHNSTLRPALKKRPTPPVSNREKSYLIKSISDVMPIMSDDSGDERSGARKQLVDMENETLIGSIDEALRRIAFDDEEKYRTLRKSVVENRQFFTFDPKELGSLDRRSPIKCGISSLRRSTSHQSFQNSFVHLVDSQTDSPEGNRQQLLAYHEYTKKYIQHIPNYRRRSYTSVNEFYNKNQSKPAAKSQPLSLARESIELTQIPPPPSQVKADNYYTVRKSTGARTKSQRATSLDRNSARESIIDPYATSPVNMTQLNVSTSDGLGSLMRREIKYIQKINASELPLNGTFVNSKENIAWTYC